MPNPGDVVAGRYEIVSVIGRGGGGVVYLARQMGINREVAIKILPPDRQLLPAAVRRFEREARLVSRLRHPNTVTLYEFNRTQSGLLYIVMEFVEGVSLKEVIKDNPQLEPPRVVRIIRQMLKSLLEAHSMGIVHRDLKPANIMLCELYGERDYVKVLDFGVATVLEHESEGFKEDMTTTADVVGTPKYMAPEQFRSEVLSPSSDLYSVGCMAFELLAGYSPFDGETLHVTIAKHLFQPPPQLPEFLHVYPTLVRIIDRLLLKKPSERYQDANGVLADLERWNEGSFAGPSGQHHAYAPAPTAEFAQQARASSPGYSDSGRYGGAAAGVASGGYPSYEDVGSETRTDELDALESAAAGSFAGDEEYDKTEQYSIEDYLERIDGPSVDEDDVDESAPTDFYQAVTGHGDDATSNLGQVSVNTGPTSPPELSVTPSNPIGPSGPQSFGGPSQPYPAASGGGIDRSKAILFALIGAVLVCALVAVLLIVMTGEDEATAGDGDSSASEASADPGPEPVTDPGTDPAGLPIDPDPNANATSGDGGAAEAESPELLAARAFSQSYGETFVRHAAAGMALGTKHVEPPKKEPEPKPRRRRKPRKSYVYITVPYLPRNATLEASNGSTCSNGARCRLKVEKGESLSLKVSAKGFGTVKKTVKDTSSSTVLSKIYLKRKL